MQFGTQYVPKQQHVSAYLCNSWYWNLKATFAVTVRLHPVPAESTWHVLTFSLFFPQYYPPSVSHVFQDLAFISLTIFIKISAYLSTVYVMKAHRGGGYNSTNSNS